MAEVIKVGATWCAPCKTMEAILEQIELEQGLNILRIDIEETPDAKLQYGIRSIPTLVVKNDKGVFTTSGSKTKKQIEEFLTEHGAI